MPASTRQRTVVAAIAGCLLAAATSTAATGATRTTGATGATNATTATSARAPSPVEVEVTTTGTATPAYRITVSNGSASALDATLRQELPEGAAPTAVSDGGQVTSPGGQVTGLEVSWRLQLAPGDVATVSTILSRSAPAGGITAPACVFPGDGTVPYACAAASWAGPDSTAVEAAPAWWQRTPTILAGLALLALLVSGVAGWRWQTRRRRATAATTLPVGPPAGPGAPRGRPGGPAGPGSRPNQGGGGIYLGGQPGGPKLIADDPPAGQFGGDPAGGPLWGPRRASAAPPTQRNRRAGPPILLLVVLAAAILVGAATVLARTASGRVTEVSGNRRPSSGAWVGDTTTGPVGAALRDSAFEFTVYRVTCPPASGRCEATVGLRNISGHDQPWHGALQRAYLPDGNWVTVDETATMAANAGQDLFGTPVPAGQRRLFPLVFAVPGTDQPTRIELRSEVFSAGVSVDVP